MHGFDVAIFGACAAALLAILLWAYKAEFRRTVFEWEYGLLYVDGRFQRVLDAGRYWTGSPFQRRDIVVLARNDQFVESGVVDAGSEDKFVFRIAAYARIRVDDPRTAHENRYTEMVSAALRAAIAKATITRTLDALLADRQSVEADIRSRMGAPISGCAILDVTITALTLPPEVRRLFIEVERAKLESRAALERARGEHAALRSLANAAGLVKDNPALMNLRLLQAAAGASGRGNFTLVVGEDRALMAPARKPAARAR
jgi:regulator of protease activity HflC (stomatin/prohibitin superfamily)